MTVSTDHTTDAPQPKFRKDYCPPDFLVDSVDLEFDLEEEGTTVRARIAMVRNGAADAPLVLKGEELETLSVAVDGVERGADGFTVSGDELVIPDVPDRVTLETAGRLRRADGSPLPVTPVDRAELDPDAYDLRYVRGFRGARGHTASGLEVSLTPHAGLGVGSEGRSAEAGVTLKIGEGLDRLAPNGRERFGERPRWYLYAAGSGRAVGYNFARTHDGDYARSGYTQDKGSFLGDASIGVAYRKGDMQTSFGVVYREIDAGKGLRGMNGLDTDVSEGLLAFQLSIRPGR